VPKVVKTKNQAPSTQHQVFSPHSSLKINLTSPKILRLPWGNQKILVKLSFQITEISLGGVWIEVIEFSSKAGCRRKQTITASSKAKETHQEGTENPFMPTGNPLPWQKTD
jgi:hypothetical protein